MASRDPSSRHLALALRAGAIYDWLFALAVLLATPGLMAALNFPVQADPFLFRLTALPLLFFPLLYWGAAGDPRGRPWAVGTALAYRLGGGAMLGALALGYRPAGLQTFLAAAIIDIAWGALLAFLWRRVLRS